jgi:hypothetical protein
MPWWRYEPERKPLYEQPDASQRGSFVIPFGFILVAGGWVALLAVLAYWLFGVFFT